MVTGKRYLDQMLKNRVKARKLVYEVRLGPLLKTISKLFNMKFCAVFNEDWKGYGRLFFDRFDRVRIRWFISERFNIILSVYILIFVVVEWFKGIGVTWLILRVLVQNIISFFHVFRFQIHARLGLRFFLELRWPFFVLRWWWEGFLVAWFRDRQMVFLEIFDQLNIFSLNNGVQKVTFLSS